MSQTRTIKLQYDSHRLLKRLASSEKAFVRGERTFPLPICYTTVWSEPATHGWRSEMTHDATALSALVAVGAVELVSEKPDQRLWRITPRGRQIVQDRGVIEFPEEVPDLFDMAPYEKQRKTGMEP